MTERPPQEAQDFVPPELQQAFLDCVRAYRMWEWIKPHGVGQRLTAEQLTAWHAARQSLETLSLDIEKDALAYARLWRNA